LSQQQAINELRAGSGSQFDPRVVDALCVAIATTEPASSSAADEVRALLVNSSVAERLGARA
jgi:HD-GYP domain-containing protein (c-di-GMP phosphodiesterase class II)